LIGKQPSAQHINDPNSQLLHTGCLPFDQKTRLVDRCGKWKASKHEWEFHTEFAVPFTVPSDPIQKAWNWSERANGTHNFRSEIPFGNFGPPSRNPVFPGNFPFGKTKLVFPFTFQPKFLDFFVNGKQPLSYRKHWNYNFCSDSA